METSKQDKDEIELINKTKIDKIRKYIKRCYQEEIIRGWHPFIFLSIFSKLYNK